MKGGERFGCNEMKKMVTEERNKGKKKIFKDGTQCKTSNLAVRDTAGAWWCKFSAAEGGRLLERVIKHSSNTEV